MEGGVPTSGTAWVMAGMTSSFLSSSAVEAATFSLLLRPDSEVETATVLGETFFSNSRGPFWLETLSTSSPLEMDLVVGGEP